MYKRRSRTQEFRDIIHACAEVAPAAGPPPMFGRLRHMLAAAALLGFAASGPAAADTDLRIVASIKPVHSLVSAVMAGVGEPRLLMRGAASPHTFTLRPSDAAAIENADIVFLIGDTMETTLVGPLDALAGHARVVSLFETPGLAHRTFREGGAFEADDHDDHAHGHDNHDDEGHDDDRGDGLLDPHIWLDPVNGGAMTRLIAATLAEADPANAAAYEANADALVQRLDRLTEEIAATMAPARGAPFIVFHDAYRHFEDRFGLAAVGSAVVSPERPPGVKRIEELRAKVFDLGVACVFAEPQFDRRLIDVIVEGTQARTGTVDPLGAAIEDGPELYFTLLRNMASSFKDCLAPEG